MSSLGGKGQALCPCFLQPGPAAARAERGGLQLHALLPPSAHPPSPQCPLPPLTPNPTQTQTQTQTPARTHPPPRPCPRPPPALLLQLRVGDYMEEVLRDLPGGDAAPPAVKAKNQVCGGGELGAGDWVGHLACSALGLAGWLIGWQVGCAPLERGRLRLHPALSAAGANGGARGMITVMLRNSEGGPISCASACMQPNTPLPPLPPRLPS